MQKLPNNNYTSFVDEIASMIETHQVVAIKSVQSISNQLYWNIGELILAKQAKYGWGQSVIDKLSRDLMARFGNEAISYSKRNLQFMRQLVLEYSNVNQVGSHLEIENMKQAASHLKFAIVKQTASLLHFPNVKRAVSHLRSPNVNQPDSHLHFPNVNQLDSHLNTLKPTAS